MKTNLDKYKTNKDKEVNGEWFEPKDMDGIRFLVARSGGANDVRRMEEYSKSYLPHVEAIKDGSIDPEKQKEIIIYHFCKTSILDWEGVEVENDEGELVISDYDPDVMVKILMDYEELFDEIVFFSNSKKNYRDELGN